MSSNDERAPTSGARSRVRKPTLAERREQRAAVEDAAEVMDAAARFLEARPRSIAEVRRKLGGLGYRSTLVDEVMTRLIAMDYLDDEAFARSWVESRDRSSPRGEHALRHELGQKGVERSLVDGVLAERRAMALGPAGPGTGDRRAVARDGGAAAPPDEEPRSADEAAAERLLRRKLGPVLRETDLRKRRQRAYALLARGGFSPDVCSSVSRLVLDEAAADAADEEVGGDPFEVEP